MQGLVAGDHVPRLHATLIACQIGDEAARLAHDRHAGREIPRGKAAFPIDVEPAGRHIGEIEREAGGFITDLADNERTMEPGDVIAGNETMHRQVLDLLKAA